MQDKTVLYSMTHISKGATRKYTARAQEAFSIFRKKANNGESVKLQWCTVTFKVT